MMTHEEREAIRQIFREELRLALGHQVPAATMQHESLTILETQGVEALRNYCKSKMKAARR